MTNDALMARLLSGMKPVAVKGSRRTLSLHSLPTQTQVLAIHGVFQPLGIMACGPSRSDSDQNTVATLCDLPVELLLEIIQRLDNPALLSLGLACRCVHALALDTLFSKNNIRNPRSGWLTAYQTPVETLPALRNALFIQELDELNYYFNPPVERMLNEVRDLRALMSRMPTARLVKLHFSVVDHHFGVAGREPQGLNAEVWKKEFQGLLDVVLEKGCNELYVEDGVTLIGLDSKHIVEFPDVDGELYFYIFCHPACLIFADARGDSQKAIESDLNVQLGPSMDSVNRFFAPGQNVSLETPDGQRVTHLPIVPVRNIKPTKVSIHSDMLLRNPFFEWTIAMLNSGASTIGTLSMKLSDLPSENWKVFLNGITLPQLFDFEIVCGLIVPLHDVCFTDVHSFLGHHPSIEILHLYGVEVPKGIWPPPPPTIPILPRLKSIIAHPFYVAWALSSLLLDKEASPNLTDIGVSSECSRNPPAFDYSLFDHALECVAAFPTGKIKLTLRFASIGGNRNTMNNWIEKHLATANDASKSSIISRLCNVTSLVISSWFLNFNWKTMELLPEWLGMFPNLTAIEFTEQLRENVHKLEEKEFLRKVAMACRRVAFLGVQRRKLRLDKVRRNFKIKMKAEGGQGSGKDVSA